MKKYNINIFDNVKKTKKCWIWIGKKSKEYGYIYYEGKTYFAHRLFYKLFKGDLVKNLTIDHICNNKLCVNPKHLRQVSLEFNILRGNGLYRIKDRSDFSILSYIENKILDKSFDMEMTFG